MIPGATGVDSFFLFSKTKLNSNKKVNVLENYSKWNKNTLYQPIKLFFIL